MNMTKKVKTLLIVSHVIHYQSDNHLYAYGPYAREIDLWADLFPQVFIAAPLRYTPPPRDCLPFSRKNIHIIPQLERGGNTFRDKAFQIFSLPAMIWGLARAMRHADAIQVRCPGNLGLLGVILAPWFSRFRVAKYAGQWGKYRGEPWLYGFQRFVLRSRWWNAPVLVYSPAFRKNPKIISFFNAVLDEDQIQRARQVAENKQIHTPIRILFVGRLTREKNVHVLLEALSHLKFENQPFTGRIIGDGPYRPELEMLVHNLNLQTEVTFSGSLPIEQVLEQYEWGDILVLASQTEGWPKAILEGMAYGLNCIGSNRGLIPYMLSEGRGYLVEPGKPDQIAEHLLQISRNPEEFRQVSLRASQWASNYSTQKVKEGLRKILTSSWGITF